MGSGGLEKSDDDSAKSAEHRNDCHQQPASSDLLNGCMQAEKLLVHLTVDQMTRFSARRQFSPAGTALDVGVDQVRSGLRAVAQCEFMIQPTHVVAHCLLTELEFRGNFRVVGTLGDHAEHIRFSLGQTNWTDYRREPIEPLRCTEP